MIINAEQQKLAMGSIYKENEKPDLDREEQTDNTERVTTQIFHHKPKRPIQLKAVTMKNV